MKKAILVVILAIVAPMLAKADWGLFSGVVSIGAPNVTGNSANLSAVINLISGDPALTDKGFVWSTSPNPTTGSNTGSHSFGISAPGPMSEVITYSLTGLTANTTYYVKAYATNTPDGTMYSQEVTFTAIPTLGEWGLIAFGGLIAIIGGTVVWRRFRIS